jgi:hypothetical protein
LRLPVSTVAEGPAMRDHEQTHSTC